MMTGVTRALGFADRHAGKLLLIGMAGVALHNRRLWQRDQALLAEKGRPEPLPPLESWPGLPPVSVLVAAWNEAGHVERHIRSFRGLRYPRKELVLCAGGPDGTYAIAARLAGDGVIVLEQRPGEGKQRALARSLPQATREVIFLTDADCVLDDDSFERTLFPVATGAEQACTGSSKPTRELTTRPVVVAQAAGQLYLDLSAPAYAPGILGRNCAVRRETLETSRSLEAPASTGTDYVLAKELARAGVRIRQMPQSRVSTEYPADIAGYVRQQRRWLRNVFLHGRKYGADAEARASLRTSAVGAAMLGAPLLIPLAGSIVFAPWLMLFGHGVLSRLRYLRVASTILGFRPSWKHAAVLPLTLTLDFAAWSSPLLDYFRPGRGGRW